MRTPYSHCIRFASVASLLLLAGCDLSWLNVRIPDFNSKGVRGVWVWRRQDTTGAYQRDTQIVFAGLTRQSTGEVLGYRTTVGPKGEQGTLPAGVARDPANADVVTVQIGFKRRSAPGSFKVTTYNVAGDSPLSATAVTR